MMIKVADLRGATDEQLVLDLLEGTGVLVVHGSGFGCDPAAGCFRLAYLADERTPDASFKEIGRFMARSQAELLSAV